MITSVVEKFRKETAALPRKEILERIKKQDPDLIMQIKRIEWVFSNKMKHLGIKERPVTNEELALVLDPPFEEDPHLTAAGFNILQQKSIHIASDPVLWAKSVLNAEPKLFQILILRDPSLRRVLRLGRRMGKTYSLAIALLHYAYTTTNGRCLVMAPAKTQVGLIYDQMMEFIQAGNLSESVTRNIRSPQYEINFSNGATIRLFTTGVASGGKSTVARGQEAHMIVLDEMDYMGSEDVDALFPMLRKTAKNQPDKILIAASTPSGRKEQFWDWATQDPNFKEIYFPSYVDPLWDQPTEDEQRAQHTANAYRREIEADWGEDAAGVYPRRYVELAFKSPGWKYRPSRENRDGIYLMGVDWDKYGAGPNIVILEFTPNNILRDDAPSELKLVFREEIPKDSYVFIKAVERIIQLNSVFDPAFIYVDAGSGEMQYEALMKHGVDNPYTRLKDKVKRISFAQTIDVRDPFTKQPIKKEIKPFMVDNLRLLLENEEISFPAHDEELYMQLISYIVLRVTPTGRPIFEASGSQKDHAHDALILACLAYTQNYGELFKIRYARQSKAVKTNLFIPVDVSKDTPDEGSAPLKRKGAWRSHSGLSSARMSRKKF